MPPGAINAQQTGFYTYIKIQISTHSQGKQLSWNPKSNPSHDRGLTDYLQGHSSSCHEGAPVLFIGATLPQYVGWPQINPWLFILTLPYSTPSKALDSIPALKEFQFNWRTTYIIKLCALSSMCWTLVNGSMIPTLCQAMCCVFSMDYLFHLLSAPTRSVILLSPFYKWRFWKVWEWITCPTSQS